MGEEKTIAMKWKEKKKKDKMTIAENSGESVDEMRWDEKFWNTKIRAEKRGKLKIREKEQRKHEMRQDKTMRSKKEKRWDNDTATEK